MYPALTIALTGRRDEIATIIDADQEYIFLVHSVTPSVCLKLVYPTLTMQSRVIKRETHSLHSLYILCTCTNADTHT